MHIALFFQNNPKGSNYFVILRLWSQISLVTMSVTLVNDKATHESQTYHLALMDTQQMLLYFRFALSNLSSIVAEPCKNAKICIY